METGTNTRWRLEKTARVRMKAPGGDSHMKGAGMLVENFQLNP